MNAEELDHSVMRKGKYGPQRGNPKTPNEVADIEPSYLVWAYTAWTDGKPCSHLLYQACRQDMADNQRSERVARDQDE